MVGVNSAGKGGKKKGKEKHDFKKEGKHCWLLAKLLLLSRFE